MHVFALLLVGAFAECLRDENPAVLGTSPTSTSIPEKQGDLRVVSYNLYCWNACPKGYDYVKAWLERVLPSTDVIAFQEFECGECGSNNIRSWLTSTNFEGKTFKAVRGHSHTDMFVDTTATISASAFNRIGSDSYGGRYVQTAAVELPNGHTLRLANHHGCIGSAWWDVSQGCSNGGKDAIFNELENQDFFEGDTSIWLCDCNDMRWHMDSFCDYGFEYQKTKSGGLSGFDNIAWSTAGLTYEQAFQYDGKGNSGASDHQGLVIDLRLGSCNSECATCVQGSDQVCATCPAGKVLVDGTCEDGRCAEHEWPDLDHNLVCGECKVLVNNFESYGTCSNYCANLGRTCVGAWDEDNDTCAEIATMTCDQTLASSDAICECGDDLQPTQPADPTDPPANGGEDPDMPPSDGEWNLVWADEFDGSEVDTSKWGYDYCRGCGNNEAQRYTDENAEVIDGKLVITARRSSWGEYTSSKLESTMSWKYGKFEISARLPAGRGTWPAFWMLPTENEYGGWPWSGEIDVLEHVGYDEGKIHGTVHTGAYNHMKGTQKGGSTYIHDATSAFHTYTVEWEENSMKWFVDGNQYYEFYRHGGSAEWPFDQNFYIILNLAVGGSWGGAQGIDANAFPTSFEIDYVRAYKRTAGQCDEETWPDVDNGQICGDCKVLVNNFATTYGTCGGYCGSMGMTCVGAWDEVEDTCQVLSTLGCDQALDSSDAICECAPGDAPVPRPTDPVATPDPTDAPTCDTANWPDIDSGLICGECKVLVNNFDSVYGTCGGYCDSLGLTCKGGWEEVDETCQEMYSLGCYETVQSSDALCECNPPGVVSCGAPVPDSCANHINWAQETGRNTNPEWYSDFTDVTGVPLSDSTTEDMTLYFACRDTGHEDCQDIELPCGRSCQN